MINIYSVYGIYISQFNIVIHRHKYEFVYVDLEYPIGIYIYITYTEPSKEKGFLQNKIITLDNNGSFFALALSSLVHANFTFSDLCDKNDLTLFSFHQ